LARWFFLLLVILFMVAASLGQTGSPTASQAPNVEKTSPETTFQKIRDVPAEWLIGPYIPSTEPLQPLTNRQRREVYINQTFGNFGAYFARMFTAGVDQARGVPRQWGGGMTAYGERFGSRYGQFVIANTFQTMGNAALGYESRYDLCRCRGFWPRTRHAISRNFVTYNRTEIERRPAIPLYAGSFGAGMVSSIWLPGHRNVWKEGAYSALSQAGWGIGINFASEFAIDILRKITSGRYPKKR
jgi:hypothetical protein